MRFQDLATPTGGVLACRIFANPHIGLVPTLFFDIAIELSPFEFDGILEKTSVRLDFIRFEVRSLDELSGKRFVFPTNPEDGYIDGSIYLGHAHNPADATEIAFGPLGKASVETTLKIQFDFTYEGVSEALGKPSVLWRVPLRFDRAGIDKVFAEAHSRIWR
ncbi:hypothetical protein [Pelagibius sp.]|uniref:hypothetical protein n=1 Tax=Pelagibius sp. TaxID=1931238 RepID=UPI0026381E37|nr:hypothetical protein [Pelagibius sp.]